MLKKSFLFILFLFLLSCTSPYSSGGVKFSSRKGNYQNADKNIYLSINDQKENNLSITVNEGMNTIINETLTVNSEASAKYMSIKSVAYTNYLYMLNFGNGVNDINITIRDDKDKNIVFNKKLSRIK